MESGGLTVKLKDLKGIIYNSHGSLYQTIVLWRFNNNGELDEYASGMAEYIINDFSEKDVKRIQTEISNGTAVIVIQTN